MQPHEHSELGFGTSSLARNYTTAAAQRNLATAFELGITHFDTAPAYGFGHAEMLLGKFIRDKRQQVTVTTKFGIIPKRVPFVLLPAFNLVRVPLKKLLAAGVRMTGSKHHHAFAYTKDIDTQKLEDSLHNSLRELRTDYVDYYMLHQIDASLANRDDVVETFLKLQEAGKIRRFGLAGSFEEMYGETVLRPEYTTIQFGDHLNRQLFQSIPGDFPGRKYFRFGVFSLLKEADKFLRGVKDTGVGPAELCLAYFSKDRDRCTTLFSSSRDANIRDVVRSWEKASALPEEMLTDFAAYLRKDQKTMVDG